VRVATWNVNSLKARLPKVEEWLAYAQPDVLCLQETKLADTAFPALTFSTLGYESAHHGQGRWNGVAILSRVGLDDVVAGFSDERAPDTDARVIWATCGAVRIASVYVPNGRGLAEDHYRYKLDWLARLRAQLDARHEPTERLAICGDYNVAPTDEDVWDATQFIGSTHVSEPERSAVAALEGWGLSDAFRRRHREPGLYSYWDYRAGMFHKHQGMRIDLILATSPLTDNVTFALIDRQARKGAGPSDHAPVLVDFASEA